MNTMAIIGMLLVLALSGGLTSPSSAALGVDNAQMLIDPNNQRNEIATTMVPYAGTTQGYLAKPAQQGTYPGIVMIHEWWGLNDNIKEMANELARQGYVVLAVDLNKGEVAQTPERARELTSSIDQASATENLRQAVGYLRNSERVSKVGSLGWCFGGGQSLQLALSSEPMDATVIYYGQLTDDRSRLSAIRWPVLGIFGDQDQSILVSSVDAFQSALNGLGIVNEIYIYPGVGHAFANPSGSSYAPEATNDAWKKTVSFLDRNLK